jgi:hypothetical protein
MAPLGEWSAVPASPTVTDTLSAATADVHSIAVTGSEKGTADYVRAALISAGNFWSAKTPDSGSKVAAGASEILESQ